MQCMCMHGVTFILSFLVVCVLSRMVVAWISLGSSVSASSVPNDCRVCAVFFTINAKPSIAWCIRDTTKPISQHAHGDRQGSVFIGCTFYCCCAFLDSIKLNTFNEGFHPRAVAMFWWCHWITLCWHVCKTQPKSSLSISNQTYNSYLSLAFTWTYFTVCMHICCSKSALERQCGSVVCGPC